jgi:hypothetical protein
VYFLLDSGFGSIQPLSLALIRHWNWFETPPRRIFSWPNSLVIQ